MISDEQMTLFLRSNPDFLAEIPAIMRDFALLKYVGEGKAEGRQEAAPAKPQRSKRRAEP